MVLVTSEEEEGETGASRQMIFHYYRELVTPEQAKEGFANAADNRETEARQRTPGTEGNRQTRI
jgi:hypothetical protein